MASHEPVDVVYLWVDGSDPEFREQLRAASTGSAEHDPRVNGSCRFRDNGELLYSLRSVTRFAPWVNHIYVVTNGQKPGWLDTRHSRVSIVTHKDIFPDPGCLPCFNSGALEWNLHRIPGISQKFLYFNDDYFLGRETPRDRFLLPEGRQVLYFEHSALHRRMASGAALARSYLHTGRLLDELPLFNQYRRYRRAYSTYPLDRLPFVRPRRLLPAHVPQLYDRDILCELETRLAPAIQEVRGHRFRHPRDVILRLAYHYYLVEGDAPARDPQVECLDWGSPEFFFVRLLEPEQKLHEELRRLSRVRPQFFNMNDDLGDADPGHPILSAARDFLETYFPEPSPLERAS